MGQIIVSFRLIVKYADVYYPLHTVKSELCDYISFKTW